MANDLISREAAVEMLREKAKGYFVSMFATSSECHVARVVATECAAEIKDMPAVDAEIVKHGEMIVQDETYTRFICSNCRTNNQDGIGNYCPYCGAKMDEEVQGNDD